MRGKVIRMTWISREDVQGNPTRLFVFGDNMEERGLGGQAAVMRGEPNAIGVPTKWRPGRRPEDYFTDEDLDDYRVRQAIDDAFTVLGTYIDCGRHVVIPKDGLGTGLAELPRRAPRIHRYILEHIEMLEHD